MNDVIWEPISVAKGGRKIGEPCASIGHGRIALNADACDLIDTNGYDWVEILKGKVAKKIEKIGIRFLKERSKTSLKVARRKVNNELVPGININSKSLIKELFGESGVNANKRYAVVVEKDNKNMLVIDLNKEIA